MNRPAAKTLRCTPSSRVVILTIGPFLLAVLSWLLWAESGSSAGSDQHVGTDHWISAPGRVVGVSEQLELRPSIEGRVLEVCVTSGQFVESGDLLVLVDEAALLAELARAQAELKVATGRYQQLIKGAPEHKLEEARSLYGAQVAELEQIELTLQRINDLRTGQVATQQELDAQRALQRSKRAQVHAAKSHLAQLEAPPSEEQIQITRAQVEMAQAGVELVRLQLAKARITSPLAGQVLWVNVQPGELIGPQMEEPAIIVADTSELRIRAFVEESDAHRAGVGMIAHISAQGIPGGEVTGRVIRVSPAVGPKELLTGDPTERFDSDVCDVWLQVDECDGLIFGRRVDVLIDTRQNAQTFLRQQ